MDVAWKDKMLSYMGYPSYRHALAWKILTVSCLMVLQSEGDLVTDVAGQLIDMSHTITDDSPYWGMDLKFKLIRIARGMSDRGFWWEVNRFKSPEHIGTHIDAPAHVSKGKQRVDKIPLESLVGQAIHMNFIKEAKYNRDFQVKTEDIKRWEDKYGILPPNSIVLFSFGWSQKWPDPYDLLGTKNLTDTSSYHYPGLHEDAAKWLVENRKQVKAVGTDACSIDYGPSYYFKTHQTLYAQNVPAYEFVANVHLLPPKNATVFGLPMKIKDGSGAPVRMIAVIPHNVASQFQVAIWCLLMVVLYSSSACY